MTYKVVIQYRSRSNQIFAGEIVSSPTRSGASRKANNLLRKETFFEPVSKHRMDNYEYWTCRDIADIARKD